MIVLGKFGENCPQLVSRHGEIAGVTIEEDVHEKPSVEIAVDQIQQVISLGSADDDLGDVVAGAAGDECRGGEHGAHDIGCGSGIFVLIDHIVAPRRGNGQAARAVYQGYAACTGNVHDAFEASIDTDHCATVFSGETSSKSRRYT
ncbi:hypothetical protein [Nocardia sp. NPDC059239]|uniref:hypothetical protein n=1 Tax=Nocardia sp. NPDC059239 TaxID=3346785 RepID=UPI0036CC8F9C